ncbi:hypothetical protein F5Y18DRAFT_24014 [Xylariaceae sp. FL1019]|nr:hypothetical protein F5Y18DRAFT_24014 [Xylariaceae sp. FL1019]
MDWILSSLFLRRCGACRKPSHASGLPEDDLQRRWKCCSCSAKTEIDKGRYRCGECKHRKCYDCVVDSVELA